MKNDRNVLFLIPGFGQKTTDKYFAWLVKFLQTKGFRVIGVPIKWKGRTMSDYISDFNKFYNDKKSINNYLFGFSYGAVIAFATASELKPKKIYLSSLSPDFKEDVLKMKTWVRKLVGKRRLLDLKKRSGKEIARKLSIPSVIFYGEKEAKKYPQLKIRCEETVKLAKNAKLVVVKEAPHDINNEQYMLAIKNEFD